MIYVILGALVAIAGVVVWAIIERGRASAARREANEARILADAEASARKVEAATARERERRLEEIITRARAEIASLDGALAECRDPRAVATRLAFLLGGRP